MLSSRACNWIWIENWIWNIDTDHIFNPHRSKPFKYTYEKEIVMYAYHKKLDYFSTECIYSPNAYRGHARAFIKDLEKIRPSTIIDIIHSGTIFTVLDSFDISEQNSKWFIYLLIPKVGCLWKFFRGKFEIQDRHQGKDADGRQVYPMWLHLKHGGKFCKFCVFYEPLFTVMILKTGLQGLPSIRGLEQGPT